LCGIAHNFDGLVGGESAGESNGFGGQWAPTLIEPETHEKPIS
jgi:hypothetical protein